MFSNRERAKRARVSAPQWEWYLTCVQHIRTRGELAATQRVHRVERLERGGGWMVV